MSAGLEMRRPQVLAGILASDENGSDRGLDLSSLLGEKTQSPEYPTSLVSALITEF